MLYNILCRCPSRPYSHVVVLHNQLCNDVFYIICVIMQSYNMLYRCCNIYIYIYIYIYIMWSDIICSVLNYNWLYKSEYNM